MKSFLSIYALLITLIERTRKIIFENSISHKDNKYYIQKKYINKKKRRSCIIWYFIY